MESVRTSNEADIEILSVADTKALLLAAEVEGSAASFLSAGHFLRPDLTCLRSEL